MWHAVVGRLVSDVWEDCSASIFKVYMKRLRCSEISPSTRPTTQRHFPEEYVPEAIRLWERQNSRNIILANHRLIYVTGLQSAFLLTEIKLLKCDAHWIPCFMGDNTPFDQGLQPTCLLFGLIVVHVCWFWCLIAFFGRIIKYGLFTVKFVRCKLEASNRRRLCAYWLANIVPYNVDIRVSYCTCLVLVFTSYCFQTEW